MNGATTGPSRGEASAQPGATQSSGHVAAQPEATIDTKGLVAFFLTGARPPGVVPNDLEERGLRPALFAGYRDLTRLRYDYPVVLTDAGTEDDWLRSLSGIIDEILCEIAPTGVEGERTRKHVLALELEIRALAAEQSGALSDLWDAATERLLARVGDDAERSNSGILGRGRAALPVDGTVVDCDGAVPGRILALAWSRSRNAKAQRFRVQAEELICKLSDILKADFAKSAGARTSDNLKASFGSAFEQAFDFDAMSKVLTRAAPAESLPEAKQRRISSALATLISQKFFDDRDAADPTDARPGGQFYVFRFESCSDALDAYSARRKEMAALVRALSIAELEVENRYNEAVHDPIFSRMDETELSGEDLSIFPSYLVCQRHEQVDGNETAKLMEILASELPFKILIETEDVLGEFLHTGAGPTHSIGGMQLASMAMGLNTASVLQACESNLYRVQEQIRKGVDFSGPSIFSIFSASSGVGRSSQPYLMSAAAHQSRAFPTFVFDPSAGADWVSRFSVENNPQSDRAWPIETFFYEDDGHQRQSTDIAFTYVDFIACDPRHGAHFLRIPPDVSTEDLIPLTAYLERDLVVSAEKIPYILMVDEDDILHRVAVEDRLIHAARRCAEMWHSLQELGGIDNSHARRQVEREREAWAHERSDDVESPTGVAGDDGPPPPTPAPAPEAREADTAADEEALDVAADSKEPFIETSRCTTCNECTQINAKMFVYNDNKQAFIADPGAGPYKDLVEAAESCQVSIIHPGEPRDPSEPNLDSLIKRAAPFR